MKVIWRQRDKDWEIAFGKAYRNEAHLQAFLAEYPAMIPFEDISDQISQPRVMLREVGLPGSGSSDIVGVDEDGGITIIECKLAANPEVKRKVIGQVLEYAAFLWRKPYTFLDEISERRLGKPLAQAMHQALDEEARQEWAEEAFVQAVTGTLESGDFRMVVAVDSMNDELRRTIEYLTEGPSRLQLFALELTYFASEGQEIIVPNLHGSIAALEKVRSGQPRTRWSEDRFFADMQAREIPEDEMQKAERLLRFCQESADHTWWGHGKEKGSFTCHFLKEGKTVSVFSVYSDGKISFNFGWLKLILPQDMVAAYRDGLRAIQGLSSLPMKEDYNYWPAVRLGGAFTSDEEIEAFERLVLGIGDWARA